MIIVTLKLIEKLKWSPGANPKKKLVLKTDVKSLISLKSLKFIDGAIPQFKSRYCIFTI